MTIDERIFNRQMVEIGDLKWTLACREKNIESLRKMLREMCDYYGEMGCPLTLKCEDYLDALDRYYGASEEATPISSEPRRPARE